jgi:transcriptional regulator with XRE-family HTH domain
MIDAARVGGLLAYWRGVRRMSQLALAMEAEISARHLSFIESGRAKPSREMVLLLGSVLEVPLRERNRLLKAAGFASVFRESELAGPELAIVRQAFDAILAQHAPYPAVVLDRRWNIVSTNPPADRFFGFLLAGSEAEHLGPPNVLRSIFHPRALRPWITNWAVVAEALIQRVHREAIGNTLDEDVRALLGEVLRYPGVPERFAQPDLTASVLPIIPVCFERGGRRFSYFSTVTSLGTPIDITAQELRIECFFPVDDETRAAALALTAR